VNILFYLQGVVKFHFVNKIIYSQVVFDSHFYLYMCIQHNGDGALKALYSPVPQAVIRMLLYSPPLDIHFTNASRSILGVKSTNLIVRIQDDSSIKPLYIVHKSA
jgi:hypothetical protein